MPHKSDLYRRYTVCGTDHMLASSCMVGGEASSS